MKQLKLFAATLVSALLLIVGSAIPVACWSDAGGVRAYLNGVLPHQSVVWLCVTYLLGLAYSAGAFIASQGWFRQPTVKYAAAQALYGLVGVGIAYASWVLLPSYDSGPHWPQDAMWLVGIMEVTMMFFGVFFPAVAALASVLAIPLLGAIFGMFDWAAAEPKYRSSKVERPLLRFFAAK